MKKVSVIIPAYNCARTLERCINSVLSQTGAETEIIAVNDGSTDGTARILSQYGDKITVISKENGGVSSARNLGLEKAEGDFVMFVDSDDALEEGCICDIIEKQAQTDADIVRFDYKIVAKGGRTYPPFDRFEKDEYIEKGEFKNRIYPRFINGIRLNSVWGNLYKKSVIEKAEFRCDMTTAEDAVFSIKAYTRAKSVFVTAKPYYLYYRSEGSATGNGLSLLKKYRCNFIVSAEIIRHLPLWEMNTPVWRLRALLRPLRLTLDKLRRIKEEA